jgi:hypothetical protein
VLAAAGAPHNAALPTITVAMTGTSITVGGALRSGGVRIVSTVTHERQGEPIFVRLDPGVTLKQFFKVLPLAAATPTTWTGSPRLWSTSRSTVSPPPRCRPT